MPRIDGDADLVLHYAPRTRSFSGLWLVEETGLDYRLEAFDLSTGHHLTPEYAAINPMKKVPVLVDRGIPVSELGAIAIYLADRFPEAKLGPTPDHPDRAAFLRWVFFASAIMEPAFGEKFFKWDLPASSVAWGSFDRMWATLLGALEDGRTFLLGDAFTSADALVAASLRFGQMFGILPTEGPTADYVARAASRPACLRAAEIEREMGERFPMKKA